MRGSGVRIGITAVIAVAAFSWINRKTVRLPVRPYN